MIRLNKFYSTFITKFQTNYTFSESFNDKEKIDDNIISMKEDQQKSQKLGKLSNENNQTQKNEIKNRLYKEDIQRIFSKYKLTYSEAFLDEILQWKKNE